MPNASAPAYAPRCRAPKVTWEERTPAELRSRGGGGPRTEKEDRP
ncbi:hypothetical protein [Streptomyces iconiensis]|uniref:Uncharacterized protein n=1 Tax=Streptomyces iconiensis TaxID=1384038 RepID=A0ABT7AAE8_9ACTN|nr:hypothetical protein [Streptomyces iconiensis]MDJ1137578.1 hypothetical protein [Streptomyces iconiensis]